MGPVVRDYWGYSDAVQFLANRGYAVLQVNYRGSTSYGPPYMLAGTREFGRKMHDDLIDGVRWASERGIADPARVAIMGASYAAMPPCRGSPFTPEVFAAGIDRVGIADMISLIENWPQYWGVGIEFWSKFFGTRPIRRTAVLAERSPINRAMPSGPRSWWCRAPTTCASKRDHSDRIVEVCARRQSRCRVPWSFPTRATAQPHAEHADLYARRERPRRTIGGRDGGDVAE